MHGDIKREIEEGKKGSSQEELDVWTEEFDWERPHEALGMKCPGQVYVKSERKYEGLPALEYAGMEKRRIMKHGRLVWEGETIFISSALGGWDVGLKRVQDHRLEVYFADLRLGELDPRAGSFNAARPRGVGDDEKNVTPES